MEPDKFIILCVRREVAPPMESDTSSVREIGTKNELNSIYEIYGGYTK